MDGVQLHTRYYWRYALTGGRVFVKYYPFYFFIAFCENIWYRFIKISNT
jgi:hypothetical protein